LKLEALEFEVHLWWLVFGYRWWFRVPQTPGVGINHRFNL